MKIANVEAFTIQIPLPRPVYVGRRELFYRDHTIVRLTTDDGVVGYGDTDCYGAGKIMTQVVRELLAPLVIGESPFNNELIWDRMFQATKMLGRRGLVIRSMSPVDIAMWDLKGKYAGLPIHKMLGVFREKVPSYVSGGYYRKGEGLEELRAEMTEWKRRKFKAVKVRVGLASVDEDIRRLSTIREALGDDTELLMDAEHLWDDFNIAMRYVRAFREFNPYWLEGPCDLNRLQLMKAIAESTDIAIATGGQEYTRWGFLELIRHGVRILQPDAMVVGGITEWIKVAHIADSYDLKVCPHANWNLHSHLVASTQNALFVEYFDVGREIKVIDKVVKNPVVPEDGFITPPQDPGYGIEFDEAKLEEYRVS